MDFQGQLSDRGDILGAASLEDSGMSDSSSETSEADNDFAKQLRKQRKQVLEEGGARPQKKQDFSQILRQHREDLVETWTDKDPKTSEGAQDDLLNSLDKALNEPLASPSNLNESDIGAYEATVADSSDLVNQSGASFDDMQFFNSLMTPPSVSNKASTPNPGANVSTANGDSNNFGGFFTPAQGDTPGHNTISNGGKEASGPFAGLGGTINSDISMFNVESPAAATNSESADVQRSEEVLSTAADPVGQDHNVSKPTEMINAEPSGNNEQEVQEKQLQESINTSTELSTPATNGDVDEDQSQAHDQSGDEDFGDFGSAPVSSEPAENAVQVDASAQTKSSLEDLSPTLAPTEEGVEKAASAVQDQSLDNVLESSLETTIQQPSPMEIYSEGGDNAGAAIAVSTPQDQSEGAGPSTKTNGDEMNAFKEPTNGTTTTTALTNNQAPVEPQSVDMGDDFGDIEAAQSSLAGTGASSEEPTQDPVAAAADADDFGDFDTAPVEPTPEAQSANTDDHFGDFGAASLPGPAQVATTETSSEEPKHDAAAADVTDDDFGDFDTAPIETTPTEAQTADAVDDFGDFGTAPAPEQTQDAAATADAADDDDDFGGFDTAPVEPTPTEAQTADAGDDFGDFGAAPSPEPVAATGTGATSEEPTQDAAAIDDDFGDFDTAPVEPTPTEAQTADAVDDFGDFGAAPSPEPVAATGTGATSEEPTQDAAAIDDDFGDFDTAPVEPTPTEAQTADAVDDFGDFGAAPSPEQTQDAAATADAADDDDDFGGFDTAPVEPTPTEAQTADAGDDFGDFGAAPSPEPVAATGTGATSEEPTQDAAAIDDDFGDFDTAPVEPTPTEAQTADAGDDFGDFGAAPSPEPVAATGTGATSEEPTQDAAAIDDDFGDFDTAPVEPTPTEAQTADAVDDFGDFGAAPSPEPVAATAASSEGQTHDATADDDFGDFDTAPVAATGASSEEPTDDAAAFDDDFGDFDTAEDNPKRLDHSTRDSASVETSRILFDKLVKKFAFDEPGRGSSDIEDVETLHGSLQGYLKKTQDNTKNPKTSSEMEDSITSLLKSSESGTGSKSARTIAESDGRGPNFHFMFPVGGLHIPDLEVEMLRHDRGSSVIDANLAGGLSIQIPTGRERPLQASPKSNRNSNVMPSRASKSPDIVGSRSAANESGSNVQPQVMELLRKVPDLSFMLQTSLVTPR